VGFAPLHRQCRSDEAHRRPMHTGNLACQWRPWQSTSQWSRRKPPPRPRRQRLRCDRRESRAARLDGFGGARRSRCPAQLAEVLPPSARPQAPSRRRQGWQRRQPGGHRQPPPLPPPPPPFLLALPRLLRQQRETGQLCRWWRRRRWRRQYRSLPAEPPPHPSPLCTHAAQHPRLCCAQRAQRPSGDLPRRPLIPAEQQQQQR